VRSKISCRRYNESYFATIRQGDEQELVTVFGLLQAVASIVEDSGDNLRCIRAGKTRILYMIRHSLYFVAVSSKESEAALLVQLQFLYSQILFILTAKVIHSICFLLLKYIFTDLTKGSRRSPK
jgi:hypothetical protein